MDAVTGSWSGVDVNIVVCLYQCHIRAPGGRDGFLNVCSDIMISPGVCTAIPPNTHSDTMIYRLISL